MALKPDVLTWPWEQYALMLERRAEIREARIKQLEKERDLLREQLEPASVLAVAFLDYLRWLDNTCLLPGRRE